MTEKRFHREEYPFDILSEFGLTEEMVYDLPDYVHDRIESGGKSPLLPITIRQPFGCTRCYAKFCLVETEDGIDVLFSPKLKETDLSAFSESERQLLKQGKAIIADIFEETATQDNGTSPQKIKAFVQIDRDTNSVVYAPTQIIGRNLMTVSNELDLSDEDLKSFWHGGIVTVQQTDDQGNTGTVTVGIDLLSEKGVVLIAGDVKRWEKLVRKTLPEYSFGNDGCWVNRNGLLSYVPEDSFTPDIIEALERQARANGLLLDNRQNMEQSTSEPSYANEENRQPVPTR